MIHCCTFLVTHMVLEIYLIIRVICDIMANNKLKGTVKSLMIMVSDYWHGVGTD